LVKKKIKVRNRSFQEVFDDLNLYFKSIRKILPPGVLEDSLITIGVPRAKKIISEEKEIEKEEPVQVDKSEPEIKTESEIVELRKETDEEPEEESEPISLKPGTVTVIEDKDLPDIEDALTAVESLSDSFMAPSEAQKQNSEAVTKPQIRISLKGTDEIVASQASIATDPNQVIVGNDTQPKEISTEPEKLIEELEEMIETPETDEVQDEESVDEMVEITPEEVTGSVTLEEATSLSAKKTPTHAVRPLINTKAVILGEDGVGKHSLMEKAGLKIQTGPEIDGDPKEYIHSAIFRLEDYRVDIDVWSFDDASNAKVSRREFYSDASVIIIVYAVSDRWSFESIDFWLREATVKHQEPPPIVLVGNKKDIRDTGEPDPLEPAVTSEEGFKFAEALAKKMGTDDKLHPVAFIETSCLTGEGTEDVFRTASEFYTNTL
jgi:GTPase SAR1 family protein